MKHDGVGWLLMTALYGGAYVASYGFHMVLTRLLGQTDYGLFLVPYNLLLALAPLATLGWNESTVRFTVALKRRADKRDFVVFLRTGNVLVSGLSLLITTLLWVLAPTEPAYLGWVYLSLPALAFSEWYAGTLRANGQAHEAFLLMRTLRPVVIVAVTAFLIFGFTLDPLVALSLGLFLTMTGVGALLWIRGPRIASPDYGTMDVLRRHIRRWVTTSLRLLLVSSKVIVRQRWPIILIGFFINPVATSVFFIADRLASLVLFGREAVGWLLAPRIAARYHTDRKAMARITRQSMLFSLCIAITIAMLIWLMRPLFIALFGIPLPGIDRVLAILLLAEIIHAAQGPAIYWLNLTGHEGRSLWLNGSIILLALVLFPFALFSGGLVWLAGCIVLLECWHLVGILWQIEILHDINLVQLQ